MDDPGGPIITSSDDRARTWLIGAGGILATIAVVVAMLALWPDSGDPEPADGDEAVEETADESATTEGSPATSTGNGEPSQQASTVPPEPDGPADLFRGDLPAAYDELRRAAGDPAQILELAVYETYAFLAYRDPAAPGNIDRRIWRDGEIDDAQPNPIDDRVDSDTEPALFAPAEVDPAVLTSVVADAPGRYAVPTEVTHVLVTRFLPFDERVLIRVYASPTDGRSGGGYVSYATDGTFVAVCC